MLFSGNCNTSIFGRWTMSFSGDWKISFSWDWNISFLGNYNTSIFGRLKCVIFGRLQCTIFERLKCAIFGRLKCAFFGGLKCIIFWRLNFILKTVLKAILKTILLLLFLYYYSINPVPYGERSSTTPLRLFVRNFFCKSYNLDFFFFKYFYSLRGFLANFQGYIASSGQKLSQTAWKKCQKKAKKSQNLSKNESQKRAYQVVNFFFFLLQSFILSWPKSLKSFKLIPFMVLGEIPRRSYLTPIPLSPLPPVRRAYTQRPYEIGLNYFLLFYSEFLNFVKESFGILNALNRNSKCATFRLNLILFRWLSLMSRVFVAFVYFKRLLLLYSLYLTCPF